MERRGISLSSVQDDEEAKRLVTLAVLQKGFKSRIISKWNAMCAVNAH